MDAQREPVTMQMITFPTQNSDLTEIKKKYLGLIITDEASYKEVSAALKDVVLGGVL